MNRQTKQIGTVLALVAMVSFGAWPFWKALYFNAASAALYERTHKLVENHTSLKTAWDVAIVDGVLAQSEATIILQAAGEKVDSAE